MRGAMETMILSMVRDENLLGQDARWPQSRVSCNSQHRAGVASGEDSSLAAGPNGPGKVESSGPSAWLRLGTKVVPLSTDHGFLDSEFWIGML